MSEFFDTVEHPFVTREAFGLFVGKKIGFGAYREVYECKSDSSLVIKFELNSKNFSNVLEWEFWQKFKDNKVISRWFAPCVDISANGAVLLQKRVQPMRIEEMPRTMPEFLCDFKVTNYGLFEGRVVCCDYAGSVVNLSAKRVKVDWWEHP